MKMIVYYGLYCHRISTQMMTYQRLCTNVLDSPLCFDGTAPYFVDFSCQLYVYEV